MSTLVTKNLQIGADGTEANNFTVYQPASPDGTLRIGNGNSGTTSAQVVLTSAGNVGIGTSSPLAGFALHVSGGIVASSGSASRALSVRRSDQSGAGQTDQVIIDVNTGSGAARFLGLNVDAGSVTGQHQILRTGEHLFLTGNTERARIDANGNFLVGSTAAFSLTSSTGTGFRVNSSGQGIFYASGQPSLFLGRQTINGAVAEFFRSGVQVGSIQVTTTATSYNTSSDYRLKHDIQPMTGALARVAALKPVTYKWNADDSADEGFIAHELAEVCPSAVSGEKDAVNEDGSIKPQGIDTSFLVATLTAAIQEQQAIIAQLQADVALLKGAPE